MSRPDSELTPYKHDILIRGRPAQISCTDIGGQRYAIGKGPLVQVRLVDEWYEDVQEPERIVETLRNNMQFRTDLFTFWQRLPETEAKYAYYHEWEEIAVLPIESYGHWFEHQIKSRLRSQLRKATREGVTLKETDFDDAFVKGMTAIFNEAPVRQGRPFWHYGKDVETVKQQFSRFIHRETMIGAYYRDRMIGLIMLGDAGHFGLTGQILSTIEHRDKATNNLLIGKAVEICARNGWPYLCYLYWGNDSLAEFKRRCGFQPMRVPRYYVPLTRKGKMALGLGLHRGWKEMLPADAKSKLKQVRRRWYARRADA